MLQDSQQLYSQGQVPTKNSATPLNGQSAPSIPHFAIAGVIKVNYKHASLFATVGTVFTVLYLLDLFFDINPIKVMYRKRFPKKPTTSPS